MEMDLLTLFSRRDSDKRVGLYSDDGEIHAAVVEGEPGVGGHLTGFLRAGSPGELAGELKRMGVRKADAHLVLSPDDYQVFQIERPEVPNEEVRQAVRWRISDMLVGRFVDPVIDWIDLAGLKSGGRSSEVLVVAACRTAIREGIERVEQAGLRMASIGVVPLALRDLMAAADEGATGYVFLQVGDAGGLMTVGRDRRFYFFREVDFGFTALSPETKVGEEGRMNVLSELSLEIQRSLDYYESHFRDGPLRELRVACEQPAVREMLIESFAESLELSVRRFEPASTGLDTDPGVAADEGDLIALGGALRHPADQDEGRES
jgi:MSHA biogenesis protein MshI